MFRVRIDDNTEEKLIASADRLGLTKSDVVRKGIEMVYDTLDEK